MGKNGLVATFNWSVAQSHTECHPA